jgi:hypothetical protein
LTLLHLRDNASSFSIVACKLELVECKVVDVCNEGEFIVVVVIIVVVVVMA